jgi:PhnB protein
MAKPIPPGYHTITAHIVVKNAVKAIDFYKKALGAKELARMEMGPGRIGHAELQIGD